MNNNSPSFTSNIRFVNSAYYKMLAKKNYIDFRHNAPNILKADEFYTEGIRTCTGGGLVSPGIEAEGFHLWDDKINNKNLPVIINSMFRFVKNPQRGLLIGSKDLDLNIYSLPHFKKLKYEFSKRIKDISYFQTHTFENAETHFQYSLKDDTWNICTLYREDAESRLKAAASLKELLTCFRKIFIADGDRLFIGKKEILPKDCPELFTTHTH